MPEHSAGASRPVDPPERADPPAFPPGVVAVLAVLLALAVLVGAGALVLSFATLEDLGVLVGYGPSLAWLLPGCLDAASAVGAVAWLFPVAPTAVPFARAVCLSALGLSVVGNGVGHALAAAGVGDVLAVVGATDPALVLVLLVGAVPPLAVGAVLHLVFLVVRDVLRRYRGEDVEGEGGRDGSDEDATPRPASWWSDEDLVSDLRRWAADPSRPTPSRDRVVAEYGVGAKRATRLRDEAGVGADTGPAALVALRPTTGTEGSA